MADTYTIQFRRGMYADFDTSKIRPGEPVAILGNDPSVPSGKALYIAFAANDVRRLCSIEDISEMVNAGEFVGPQGPRGEKGDKGDPGEKGADGTVAFESLTPEQKESLRGISIKSASVDTDGNLTITFSDGDSEDIGNIMGPQGIPGSKGDKGVGIKKITDYYALSSSNTDKAFGQVWLTTPPTMTAEKKYLWHWQRTDYTDGSFYSTEKGVIGVYGEQGPKGDKGDKGPKGDNMSDEQAAQIEQNKTDIASLKTETGSLKEDFANLKEYVKGTNFPETWEQVVLAIKSKLHREMYTVGDKFSNIWKDTNDSNKEYDNPLRINHFEDGLELEDGTTVNGMWLQTVYVHPKGVQSSHQQAFYVSNEGMTAGTYCIGFDYTWGDKGYVTKGDYWNFTLTKDVPAGGKLAGFYRAPDQPQTNWRVYVYSADGKTVLETVSTINKGQEGTLLGVMTAYGDENLNGIQQMAYGDNQYATSAIRQYLNSDKPKGEWWTAQTKWDIAPDQLSQIDGYLCGMDPELLAVLKPVKVVTYCNTVTATGQKQVKDITYDKVTLISLEQMYIEPQAAGEGEAHEYYKELNGTAKKFQCQQTYEILKTFAVENPTSPQSVRLRSASRNSAFNSWYVSSSGYVGGNIASYALRLAPLMFIGAAPSDTISAPTDVESRKLERTMGRSE